MSRYSALAAQRCSSAARTTAIGWLSGSVLSSLSTLSRTSSATSYSLACTRNAVVSTWDRSMPPASATCTRSAAAGSCPHSRPARSQDSSVLRYHSRSAAMIARSAQYPAGIQPSPAWIWISRNSRVRYSTCPDSTCPISWPMAKRRPSTVSRSTRPVVSTMNGLSMPRVMALGTGSRRTNTSGVSGRSRVAAHSRRTWSSSGYCLGPTRIAEARYISRSPRSENAPATALNTGPIPGTARSTASAPRSAGCS